MIRAADKPAYSIRGRRKMRVVLAVGSILVIMFTLMAGCGPSKSETEKPNVVVVLVDALRKDHLGCYGYDRDTTPVIDGLAGEGLLFSNPVAQAPWTAPSVASIFTSRYPGQTGVRVIEWKYDEKSLLISSMVGDIKTVSEVFNDNGYTTACVNTNPYLSDKFGINRGFTDRRYAHDAPAGRVVDLGIDIIKGGLDPTGKPGQKPFFLYLHFMDVHGPTNPPHPYDNMYPTLDGKPHSPKQHGFDLYDKGEGLDTEGFRIYRSHKTALYDGALSYVDSEVGRLARFLKEKELYDNTVIVVMADHGEELWDHALVEKKLFPNPRGRYGVGHGHTLYRELVEVPMVFCGKGVPKGKAAMQVRNVDVVPTLFGLAGIAVPPGMEGEDVIGKYNSGKLDDLPAFSEDIAYGDEMKSFQVTRYKYLRYLGKGRNEFLFDKNMDPGEHKDRSAEDKDITSSMSARMDGFTKGFKQQQGKPITLDNETREQLRALGYIQ